MIHGDACFAYFNKIWGIPAKIRFGCLGVHSLAEPFDRSLNTSLAVRDPKHVETHLDDTEYAEYHGSIDMAHVGDAESLSLHLSKPRPEHDAALGSAVILQ
jgi:hypothetical protein